MLTSDFHSRRFNFRKCKYFCFIDIDNISYFPLQVQGIIGEVVAIIIPDRVYITSLFASHVIDDFYGAPQASAMIISDLSPLCTCYIWDFGSGYGQLSADFRRGQTN
ncbi:unnamed protein product [Somion occarium]|uniref:Uncharacterized protein n=1 Tax=Somion occarium TaxID=3059160 RepID=A0ABP1CG24_9APHY